MRRWIAVAGVLLAGLLAAGAVQADRPAAEPTSDEEAVKAALVELWDAIEKGDLERYGRAVHPDYTQFGENDPYLLEGKEREVRSIGDYLKHATGVHTEMHQPRVTVRDDTAWIAYYWTDSGMVDGKRVSTRGKSTRIFVKEGGRWLCIHGHFTAVP